MYAKSKKRAANGFTLKKDMRDYSNDPYFKKKDEEAVEFFRRTGIPDFVKDAPKPGKKKKVK